MTLWKALRASAPLLATVVFLVGACGDDATGPGGDIAGTYELTTVNGAAVPAVMADEVGYKLEIVEGSVTLESGGTFTFRLQIRETVDGEVTTSEDTDSGSYSTSGSQITFVSGADETVATISGNSITATLDEEEGDLILVFEK